MRAGQVLALETERIICLAHKDLNHQFLCGIIWNHGWNIHHLKTNNVNCQLFRFMVLYFLYEKWNLRLRWLSLWPSLVWIIVPQVQSHAKFHQLSLFLNYIIMKLHINDTNFWIDHYSGQSFVLSENYFTFWAGVNHLLSISTRTSVSAMIAMVTKCT